MQKIFHGFFEQLNKSTLLYILIFIAIKRLPRKEWN